MLTSRLSPHPYVWNLSNHLLAGLSHTTRWKFLQRSCWALFLSCSCRILSGHVQQIIAEATGISSNDSQASLSQKGVDSLSAVKLSALLLDHLDVSIPASLLVSMPANKIVGHVQAIKAPSRSEGEIEVIPSSRTQLSQAGKYFEQLNYFWWCLDPMLWYHILP